MGGKVSRTWQVTKAAWRGHPIIANVAIQGKPEDRGKWAVLCDSSNTVITNCWFSFANPIWLRNLDDVPEGDYDIENGKFDGPYNVPATYRGNIDDEFRKMQDGGIE